MIGNKFPGQRRKDVLFVPLWVMQRLLARQLNERDIIDFNRISRFMSPNDLAGVLALQEKADYIVGKLAPSLTRPNNPNPYTGSCALYEYWLNSSLTNEQRELATSILKLSQMQNVIDDVVSRLFSDQTVAVGPANFDTLSEGQSPYVINDVDTDLCIMTILPGYFNQSTTDGKKLQVRALEDILRSFYRTVPQHEVSRTVWFTRYLETLQ